MDPGKWCPQFDRFILKALDNAAPELVDKEGTEYGEDCLNLNVWTPKEIGERKLPVLVWYVKGRTQRWSVRRLVLIQTVSRVLGSHFLATQPIMDPPFPRQSIAYLGSTEVPFVAAQARRASTTARPLPLPTASSSSASTTDSPPLASSHQRNSWKPAQTK